MRHLTRSRIPRKAESTNYSIQVGEGILLRSALLYPFLLCENCGAFFISGLDFCLQDSCRFNLQNSPCRLKSGGDRQRESLGCFPSPETKMPADLKDQLAFLFAHKENALLRFYKYNKYTKHNSIPTKHLKIMFFDKVH